MPTPILRECQRLADRLDQAAENNNAHDFVGCHEALAVLLVERVGAGWTLHILKDLAREKGLPGLTGACGMGPETRLTERRKLPDDWSDWKPKSRK